MVICLERDADLRTARLMPLPLTVSCFSKIQIGFTSPVPAHPGSPGQRAVKRACVCVKQREGASERANGRADERPGSDWSADDNDIYRDGRRERDGERKMERGKRKIQRQQCGGGGRCARAPVCVGGRWIGRYRKLIAVGWTTRSGAVDSCSPRRP